MEGGDNVPLLHSGTKGTTDDYHAIDVRRWRREGLLIPGRTFNWQWTRNGERIGDINVQNEINLVILSYRSECGAKEWKYYEYPVLLDRTSCHFGGERVWFHCPVFGCGRRVAILYGGVIFACRHCHHLGYSSQRENIFERKARRAEKIRAKLGWEPGILEGDGAKPIGMRWRTFERLSAEHDEVVYQSQNR